MAKKKTTTTPKESPKKAAKISGRHLVKFKANDKAATLKAGKVYEMPADRAQLFADMKYGEIV